LPATSRETVETALPSRVAMAVNESPSHNPRLISSRSAKVNRPGPGCQDSARTGRFDSRRTTVRTTS